MLHFYSKFFSGLVISCLLFSNNGYTYLNTNSLLLTGVDYSSGYYNLKHKTEMTYIPLLIKHHQNNWNFDLTFSYIKVTGPGGVYGAGDGGVIPTGDESKSTSNNLAKNSSEHGHNKPTSRGLITNEGLGDILFKVSYELDMLLQLPFLFELGGQVKIPLADEKKQLGTGEFDWSISLDLAYNLDSLTPFMTIGYKFMGDPDTVNLDNIYFSSLGIDYKVLPNLHAGVIYDNKEKVFSSSYNISESTFYLNWSIEQKYSLNSYFVKGFSHGSPDWATGLQFSFSF